MMVGYSVRLLALLLACLLFWMSWVEHKNKIDLFCGGSWFLTLFIASFFEKKFMTIIFGILFLFPLWIGLLDGAVFGFGRYSSSKSLTLDTTGYWLTMGLWLCASLGCIAYGLYKVFYKK